MKGFLDNTEREFLLEEHKKERDKRICDRIKAVLLYDKGWSYQKIAEALLISHEGVRQHVMDYEAEKKLSPKNGGSLSKMNKAQNNFLVEHLREKTYLSAKDIVAFVWEEFEVKYSVSGMTQWLQNNGFSYKKPAVVPGKANRESQENFVDEYNELKQSLPDDETIAFIDGVHPTHNVKPAYGWIEKGERKEIQTNTGRQRVNLSGLIDIFSKKVIFREDKTLEADSTIAFFKQIEEAYPEKRVIHIYCDNARYYRNKKVQLYLETSKISLKFLPPYSPNLNPIERLWKFMNEQVINNKYYEKFTDFKGSIFNFLETLSDPPKNIYTVLKKRITDNFQMLKPLKTINSST